MSRELLKQALTMLEHEVAGYEAHGVQARPRLYETITAIRAHLDNTKEQYGYISGGVKELGDFRPLQYHPAPRSTESTTIPPGMVLMPEEPTVGMLRSGRQADREWLEAEPDDVFESGLVAIYKAMLAAAKKGE